MNPDLDQDRAEVLPRMLSGRYRLDAKIGQGGMGVVYSGFDMSMRRPIAVKLIRAEATADEEAINRFLREAKNTARIQHEHIVEVFDLGRSEEGELFFVMEFLQGESLASKLRREGRLHPRLVVHIGMQVCDALDYAHRMGIVHRDLKPANLMLVRRANDDTFVKVLDFGVAKSQDQHTQLTRTGMLVGTVEYMAPEQIIGKHVDARTDIYSFGIMMYRALAGTPPFKDTGVPALINAHINIRPDPLTRRAPSAGISRGLDDVIQRCLAKRPEQRFGAMADVARALRQAIEEPAFVDDGSPSSQETVVARPGSNPEPSAPVAGGPPIPEGVSVAFDLPGAADPLDATRSEGGPPRVCGACGAENPRLTTQCRRCSAPMPPSASGVKPASELMPDDDMSDFLETHVIRTKVMPPRAPQPSRPSHVTGPAPVPPAAGAPPPAAAPPGPLAPSPTSPRGPLPSQHPPAPPPQIAPPGPQGYASPRSVPPATPVSGRPSQWPRSGPGRVPDPSPTGPTVRNRADPGITWKRVVAYLFLLVLFANMCADRFKLGAVVLFLGGAFLVSLAWLIARAREG